MIRRILFLALLPLILMVTQAVAQQPSGGGPGGPGMMERRKQALFKDITLTPAQQTKVDSISEAYRVKVQAMPRPAPGDTTAMNQRRQMMTHQEADFRAVLTKAQQEVFDKNVEALHQMMQR